MAQKVLKTGQQLVRETGIHPLRYLFERLQDRIEAEDHGHAERLAEYLTPYCARKMAAEPTEEMKNAAREGRLVVVGLPEASE